MAIPPAGLRAARQLKVEPGSARLPLRFGHFAVERSKKIPCSRGRE
jgi:hypothetical protein